MQSRISWAARQGHENETRTYLNGVVRVDFDRLMQRNRSKASSGSERTWTGRLFDRLLVLLRSSLDFRLRWQRFLLLRGVSMCITVGKLSEQVTLGAAQCAPRRADGRARPCEQAQPAACPPSTCPSPVSMSQRALHVHRPELYWRLKDRLARTLAPSFHASASCFSASCFLAPALACRDPARRVSINHDVEYRQQALYTLAFSSLMALPVRSKRRE